MIQVPERTTWCPVGIQKILLLDVELNKSIPRLNILQRILSKKSLSEEACVILCHTWIDSSSDGDAAVEVLTSRYNRNAQAANSQSTPIQLS